MAYKPELSIEGIQEVQARNVRRIAALKPTGAAGQAVKNAIIQLHRYAVSITHVGRYAQTASGRYTWAKPPKPGRGGGALRASHRMRVNGLDGAVFIDKSSRNPLTGNKPVEYGVYENARGGEHAFYDRTVGEIGDRVVEQAKTAIREAALYGK